MKNFKFVLTLLLTLLYSISTFANPACDHPFYYKLEGVNPFEKAFTPEMKTGDLNVRMDEFANKWKKNVKKIEKVKLKADMGNENRPIREQDFYVISLKNLDENQKNELMADYLNSISQNTLSFPLGRDAGHLYTRVGNQTVDNLWGLNVNEYRLSSSERLETVISFSDQEFDNLKWYLEHANRDHENVIGKFQYEGTKETVGKINDNKCKLGNGHNCTSWIGYAPIGENGESFAELIKAGVYDVARNPGWLTSYIHAYTKSSRAPFVIYMSEDALSTITRKIKTGKEFEWSYDLH